MKVFDLSHLINNELTVYKESERPDIHQSSRIEEDGYSQLHFSMYTHTGTHMDAPCHLISGGKKLDQYPVDTFLGPAFIVDVQEKRNIIEKKDLIPYQNQLLHHDFMIIYSGWYRKWKTTEYKGDFPVLSTDAAKWITQFGLKGIGLDLISVDPMGSTEHTIHRILLEHEILIIENLTNLEVLNQDGFLFSCFPLKFEDADGSPVRATGIVL